MWWPSFLQGHEELILGAYLRFGLRHSRHSRVPESLWATTRSTSPRKAWMSPRKVRTAREAIASGRRPGRRLGRYTLAASQGLVPSGGALSRGAFGGTYRFAVRRLDRDWIPCSPCRTAAAGQSRPKQRRRGHRGLYRSQRPATRVATAGARPLAGRIQVSTPQTALTKNRPKLHAIQCVLASAQVAVDGSAPAPNRLLGHEANGSGGVCV